MFYFTNTNPGICCDQKRISAFDFSNLDCRNCGYLLLAAIRSRKSRVCATRREGPSLKACVNVFWYTTRMPFGQPSHKKNLSQYQNVRCSDIWMKRGLPSVCCTMPTLPEGGT